MTDLTVAPVDSAALDLQTRLDQVERSRRMVNAAFRVWSDAKDKLDILVKRAYFGGERPREERVKALALQLSVEHDEAYARGMWQAACNADAHKVDQRDEMHEHWIEFWGEPFAVRARERYLAEYNAALAQLSKNVEQAQAPRVGQCSECGESGPAGEPCKTTTQGFDDQGELVERACDGGYL